MVRELLDDDVALPSACLLTLLLKTRKLGSTGGEARRGEKMGSADDRRFEVLRASSPTSSRQRNPSGPRPWWSGTAWVCPVPPFATTWRCWRQRVHRSAAHKLRAVPTEKATATSSTESMTSSRCRPRASRHSVLPESGVDLDDVLRRAVRLLSQLTRQVAVVQYPTLSASTVRHLEVVALTPARLLMVVITDSGRVDQRIVELGDAINEHELAQLRDLLAQALEGKKLSAASVAVADPAGRLNDRAGKLGNAVGRSATVLLESLVEHPEERLLLGGTANLTRNTADFGDRCDRCWRPWRSRWSCFGCWPLKKRPVR